MAKFVLNNPAQVDLWNLVPGFDLSNLTVDSNKQITIEFDSGNDPNDNQGNAFKLVAKGTGIVIDGGQITSGTITKFLMYDQAGNQVAKITQISIDASLLGAFFNAGEDNSFEELLHSGDNTYNGSNGSDDISTGKGNDVVNAGGSNDYIKDGGGKDTYFGGAGDRDTLTYDEWFWQNPAGVIKGIKADLSKGKVKGPDGYTDTVTGIENVRGTFKKDKFIGDGQDNAFWGFQGKDKFDGKGGFDVVVYNRDEDQGGLLGAKIYLNKGWAKDGFGNKDTLKSIEGAQGTDTDDIMVGSSKDNWFAGEAGDDTLKGKGGNDELVGGEGADSLWGDGGDDTFAYESASDSVAGSADKIKDFTSGEDQLAFWGDLDPMDSFIGTGAFTNAVGELRAFTSGADTIVQGDVDGDGSADFEIILQNFTGLTAADIDFG